MRLLVLLPFLLVACSQEQDVAKSLDQKAADRRAERIAKAKDWVAKAPGQRDLAVAGGIITVVEIPVADNKGFTDVQRCFVWRDTQSGTSSMQCVQDENTTPMLLSGPEPDHQRY
jgi:hypothetical protein